MGMWHGGTSAAGWGGRGSWDSVGRGGRGRADGWDYEELGNLYDWALMKRLLPYLAPYKGRVALVLIAMVGTALGAALPGAYSEATLLISSIRL